MFKTILCCERETFVVEEQKQLKEGEAHSSISNIFIYFVVWFISLRFNFLKKFYWKQKNFRDQKLLKNQKFFEVSFLEKIFIKFYFVMLKFFKEQIPEKFI